MVACQSAELSPLLARSLDFLSRGANEEASECLRMRVSEGGRTDEVWYAMYLIARIRHSSGVSEVASVIQAYAEAYDFLPTRLEPVAHLAKLYREAGRIETACELASLIRQTPKPSGDALGLEPYVYDVLLPLEFMLACRWLGREREARDMARQLVRQPALPAEIRSWIVSGQASISNIPEPPQQESPPFLRFVVPGWWEV